VGAWEQLLQTAAGDQAQQQQQQQAAARRGDGSFDADSLMQGMLVAAGVEGMEDEQQAADILDAEFEEVA
jgi:hypothetical protein